MSGLREVVRITSERVITERARRDFGDCKDLKKILDTINDVENISMDQIDDYIKAKDALQEILEERLRKLINIAVFASAYEEGSEKQVKGLLPEEELFFRNLIEILKRHRNFTRKFNRYAMRIRFKQDILHEIVGSDGIIYGPFKRGNIYVLPLLNARAFVMQGVAEEVSEHAQ